MQRWRSAAAVGTPGLNGLLTTARASWRRPSNATIRTMPYSIAGAAAAAGLNKTTVLRAIKAGKISGSKDEHGQWHVEPAELHRVYPPVMRSDAGRTADAASENTELRAAERELTVLKDLMVELRAQRDDLLVQRDAWMVQAQRLALPAPPLTGDQKPRSWRWWGRPWGRRLAG